MEFYTIKPNDERSHILAALTVAQWKLLANALAIDVAGDDAAGVADAAKAELMKKLKRLIPK